MYVCVCACVWLRMQFVRICVGEASERIHSMRPCNHAVNWLCSLFAGVSRSCGFNSPHASVSKSLRCPQRYVATLEGQTMPVTQSTRSRRTSDRDGGINAEGLESFRVRQRRRARGSSSRKKGGWTRSQRSERDSSKARREIEGNAEANRGSATPDTNSMRRLWYVKYR